MLINNTCKQMIPRVPHFIWVIARCNAFPISHAKVSQEFSFIENFELSDFHLLLFILRAKMSNFASKINSRVITYTNINNS